MSKLTKSEEADVYDSVHSRMDEVDGRLYNRAVANGMPPNNVPKLIEMKMTGKAAHNCYRFYYKAWLYWKAQVCQRKAEGKCCHKAKRNQLMAKSAQKYVKMNFEEEFNLYQSDFM